MLAIGGSDSGGGAGIQADCKTVTALGGYAATAVTAVTAQDTLRVHRIVAMEPSMVAAQIDCVLEDIGADCVKIGMLADGGIVRAVVECLDRRPDLPVVLDPVLRSTSGTDLLDRGAVAVLRERLLPRAMLVTPNLPEARILAASDDADAAALCLDLMKSGAFHVLLKGGHAHGDVVTDILGTPAGLEMFSAARIRTRHSHGTGCVLASAVATGIAQGMAMREAVSRARDFVRAALAGAPGLGKGSGPLGFTSLSDPDRLCVAAFEPRRHGTV